jgi:hypothetical protein
VEVWAVRLLTHEDAPPSQKGRPLANVPYIAAVVAQPAKRTVGATDDDGILRIRAHKDDAPKRYEVRLQIAKDKIQTLFLEAGQLKPLPEADTPADERDIGVEQRLFNLGYSELDPRKEKVPLEELEQAVLTFQKANGISEPGWNPSDGISDATKERLRQVYEHDEDGAKNA